MSLPANWTAGNQFTAANENSVETAVNLSTNILAGTGTATLTSPVLTTPVLGVPASGTLTNCTLPWSKLSGGTTLAGVAVTAASNLTTAIAAYQIPANTAALGTQLGVRATGFTTGANSVVNWLLYSGTSSGTTGTVVAQAATTGCAAGGGTTLAGQFTVTATGATGSSIGFCSVVGGSTFNTGAVSTNSTGTLYNTTSANYLTLAVGLATAGTATIETAFIAPGG